MKTWEKPQLIVLMRSKPEERVLNGCKSVELGTVTGSPAEFVLKCTMTAFPRDGCVTCSAQDPS